MNVSVPRPLTCLLAAALCLGLPAFATTYPDPAPDFRLPARGSTKPITLSQFRGQVVMLNFWASWCGPCRKEMPILDGIQRRYRPLGFTLVGVNVEPNSADAEAFLRQTPVAFPIAYDAQSAVSKLYQVTGMPNTVIIDRKGAVRFVHRGYQPGDENAYLDQIRMLVRE
ncbi:MAG: TlpA disulfide reductase family protein [Steroidobacteraceae bacterium]